MDSTRVPSSEKTGIRKRIGGVINRLAQKAFLNYLILVVIVGVATFLVLHYYTDLFKDKDTGRKKTMHQAIAAAGVAIVAAVAAFFARLL